MHQTKEFIYWLTGDTDAPVHFQTFHDSNKSLNNKIASARYSSFDDIETTLETWQKNQQGIFITINKTNGISRESKNITHARAVFIDGDDMPLPQEWPLYPHLIIARNPKQWHAYWLIVPSEDLDRWAECNTRIQCFYNCKDILKDFPRVMRAPGYYHFKDPNNPELYNITYRNSHSPRYTLKQIEKAFPITNTDRYQKHNPVLVGDIITDTKTNIDRFKTRLAGITPEKGDYNNTLYKVAAIGKDLGLSPDTIAGCISRWWFETWPIPVEHTTVHTIVNNAFKYGSNSVGNNTAPGVFKSESVPALPEVGTKESIKETIEDVALADEKFGKNHTINARMFIQAAKSNNVHYLTIDRETYTFTGEYWRKLKPKELEQIIHATMIDSRPTYDTVSSTAKVVGLMTANNNIESAPSWIKNDEGKPKYFIVFKNGILDIKRDVWFDHTPDLFYTHCLEYEYRPGALAPRWEKYLLEDVFDGDQELVSVLQEWIGYQLINSYEYQKIAVLIGAPRSGKGTISGVIRHLVGSHNVAAPSLSRLAVDSTLDALNDKPVAIIGDAHKVPHVKRDEVLEHLKMISGCDPVTYHRMYLGAVTTKLPTRLTIAANKMPDFIDTSGALAGRLILIPFRNSYLGKEDPGLLSRLLVEAPGIMNWAIAGLRRLQRAGRFTEPADSMQMMQTIKEDLSPITSFVNECIDPTGDTNDVCRTQDLYNIYKRWCAINEVIPAKARNFRQDIQACCYKIRLTRNYVNGQYSRVFLGMKVINSFDNVLVRPFGINQ